jgi:hypothetical protein
MAITPENFDINKVTMGDPETDRLNNLRVPIRYERNGKPGYLTLDLPLVRTDGHGISEMQQQGGGVSRSVKLMFPRKKPIFIPSEEHEGDGHYEEPDTITVTREDGTKEEVPNDYTEMQSYLDIFEQVYRKVIDHCFANKGKLRMADAKQKIMVEAQIKNPVYIRTITNEDGEEVDDPTCPPSTYFKLIESGINAKKSPNTIYTSFTGLDQKPIHWEGLKETMFYCFPKVRIESIFLGAKKNIQCKIASAVVLETKAMEDMNQDNEKIKDFLEKNPGAKEAFLRSISGLEKHRGEIKREKDSKPKDKPVEIIAQKPPIPEEDEEGTEAEPEPTPAKSGSPLENFMKQQQQKEEASPPPATTPRKTIRTIKKT